MMTGAQTAHAIIQNLENEAAEKDRVIQRLHIDVARAIKERDHWQEQARAAARDARDASDRQRQAEEQRGIAERRAAESVMLSSARFKEKFGVWVVRNESGIYALSTVCTHLGCTPNWLSGEAKFKCPCHGSGFYMTGINFEGPAPRPLERYRVVLADDGQVLIDKTKIYQQEKGQWSDPESFLNLA